VPVPRAERDEGDHGTWDGLAEAKQEAAQRGEHRVGTHHLLLALVVRPEGEAQRALRQAGATRAECDTVLAALHGPGGPPTPCDPAGVVVGDRALVLLNDAGRMGGEGFVTDEALLATMILDRNPGLAGTALWWLGVGPSLGRALTKAARVGADDDTSAPPVPPRGPEVR
jgi:hypothetical protein